MSGLTIFFQIYSSSKWVYCILSAYYQQLCSI